MGRSSLMGRIRESLMRELHGIGVGRSVAFGPVLRMPDPLAEPAHPADLARGDADAPAL